MKENNDDFFTDDLTGFPPGMLDEEERDLSIPQGIVDRIREETEKTAEDAAYFICKTTYEITQFDAYGKELCKETTTESSLISNDDTIKEKRAQFKGRDEFLQFRDKYMQSAKWQAKRQMALMRDHYLCRMCFTAKNLRVHHITYANFGSEKLEDLITLCDKCHHSLHCSDEMDKDNQKMHKELLQRLEHSLPEPDIESERTVLSFGINNSQYLDFIYREIRPYNLSKKNRMIYAGLFGINKGSASEIKQKLIQSLFVMGWLESVGGEEYINELINEKPNGDQLLDALPQIKKYIDAEMVRRD